MDDYTSMEKEILSYLSKQSLSRRPETNSSVTLLINLQFSKTKKDDAWFKMNKSELVEFLRKRNNKDFSLLDRDLKMANISPEESFYVNFY